MFGFRKSKKLRFVPFSDRKPKLFTGLLCDGVSAEEINDFATVLAVHSQLSAEHPEHRVLMTLDDPGQAAYTSGHTILRHMLDDVDGYDLSDLPKDVFADGEHQGYLTTLDEFPIRLENLRKCAAHTSFADARGVLFWGDPEEHIDPVSILQNPDIAAPFKQEPVSFCQFVPVKTGFEALAAFPNGYFHGSLNPAQSYAVCKHLETRHGYRLFGVGSRFFGFRLDHPLSHREAMEAAVDITSLYLEAPEDSTESLANELTGKDWLLLRYTES